MASVAFLLTGEVGLVGPMDMPIVRHEDEVNYARRLVTLLDHAEKIGGFMVQRLAALLALRLIFPDSGCRCWVLKAGFCISATR